MNESYLKVEMSALLVAAIGVFGVDYFSHLLFSSPMETGPYFLAKFVLFFIFSVAFLSRFKNVGFGAVLGAGIVVSALWGAYYNILPILFDYYPFGIPLQGLTFLGMGLLGTGLAFGIVHTLAFVIGYYGAMFIIKTSS